MKRQWRALRGLLWRREREQELDEELRFHIELEIAKNLERGLTPEEARYQALRRFGGLDQVKEQCRETRGTRTIETLAQDLRYGLRMLWRRPAFTSVAALTLALGIGANTAIFSLVDGLLFRPLPFKNAGEIVTLFQSEEKGSRQENCAPANFIDLKESRESQEVFTAMAAAEPYGFDMTGQGEPEYLRGWLVSEGFFTVMDVPAAMGRTFLPSEYQEGNTRVVVMSHGAWQRRFGGNEQIIGERLILRGQPYTIVGVMPPAFKFPSETDLWVPRAFTENDRKRRLTTVLHTVARLKPGVPLTSAQESMSVMAGRLAQAYPQTNTDVGIVVIPLREHLVGHLREALLVILAAVSFVLLIACVNVANLLLARGLERQKELALRATLGATQGRLLRQLFTESLLLAIIGGGLGLFLSHWCTKLLLAALQDEIALADQIGLDGRVLLFAAAATLVTSVIFGLIPALRMIRPDLREGLQSTPQFLASAGRKLSLRNLLVVTEVALALVLVVGAGLLLRSFVRLMSVDPGIVTERTAVMEMHVWARQQTPEKRAHYFQQALERIKSVPGVINASAAVSIPMAEGERRIDININFLIAGATPTTDEDQPTAYLNTVTADYFATLGIPLKQGRVFTGFDGLQSRQVVVVNEALAKRYWPGADAIGKKIFVLYGGKRECEIVGIVGNVRQFGLDTEPRPEIFLHHMQNPFGSMNVVVRTAADTTLLLPEIKRQLWEVNKDQPIASITMMDNLLAKSLNKRRMTLILLGGFAIMALALAAIGIYGLISFSTKMRTKEIGIRMALGAQRGDVLRMVVGSGLTLTLIGIATGTVVALILTRLMSGLLFGVSSSDLLTYAGTALLLTLVAVLASIIPARKAMSVDPAIALRQD